MNITVEQLKEFLKRKTGQTTKARKIRVYNDERDKLIQLGNFIFRLSDYYRYDKDYSKDVNFFKKLLSEAKEEWQQRRYQKLINYYSNIITDRQNYINDYCVLKIYYSEDKPYKDFMGALHVGNEIYDIEKI